MQDNSTGSTGVPQKLQTLWSSYAAQVVLTNVAGNKTLPTITIPAGFIPAGATVVHGLLVVKFSGRENTAASVNSISGSQSIQVEKAVGGSYINAFSFIGGEYSTAVGALISGNAEAAGDVLMGNADIVAQIPANGAVMNVQWTSAVAAFANMNINDVQVGLQIWITMP